MENLRSRLILISSWWHSYNFLDICCLIDMCPLPLCCYLIFKSANEKWKVTNIEKTQRKKERKNFNLKTQNSFLEFYSKHNIENSCGLPIFCFNFSVHSEVLNDKRHTFLKRWLIISNFELLTVVLLNWWY